MNTEDKRAFILAAVGGMEGDKLDQLYWYLQLEGLV